MKELPSRAVEPPPYEPMASKASGRHQGLVNFLSCGQQSGLYRLEGCTQLFSNPMTLCHLILQQI